MENTQFTKQQLHAFNDASPILHGNDTTAQKNYHTICQFFQSGSGNALLNRHLLFTEDGIAGLWTSDTGKPIFVQGRTAIEQYSIWSSHHFPDWRWYNIEIWQTQTPTRFWAEADGEGTIIIDGKDPVQYRNHFIYSFDMNNGLIAKEREFMNPIVEMQTLGYDTPHIDLGDFPN